MAYMIGLDRGPLAHLKDEWAMNVPEQDAWWYHQHMRIGPPRSHTGTLSVSQLKTHGVVGLYLLADQSLPLGARLVPTPPELMEPPE